MLHLLDEALEAYLRDRVPLPSGEIDVVFDRPSREWSGSVTRPTLNLFLWDIRRNSSDQEAGMESVVEDGRRVRRPPLPRIDCRYMVTAWAGQARDEHQLLGAVMATLLTQVELPIDYLPNGFREIQPPPTLQISRVDGTTAAEIWTAIEGEMRPSLDLTVTATVDAAIRAVAGPPVRTFEVQTRNASTDGEPSRRRIGEEADES